MGDGLTIFVAFRCTGTTLEAGFGIERFNFDETRNLLATPGS